MDQVPYQYPPPEILHVTFAPNVWPTAIFILLAIVAVIVRLILK